MVERVLQGLGLAQEQRALAEVVEHQRRQHEAEPGEADRGAAEVAHVGVERLRPSDRQHDRAQGDEGLPAGVREQAHRIASVECHKHARILDDLGQPEQAQGGEPGQHHRPEQPAHAGRAAALEDEQAEQHEHGERHDVGLEPGCGGLQALDGGKHRDGGGDQAIAVEQGQAAQREDEDQPLQAVALVADGPGGEGAQRQHAALAAVVGAQDEQHVLDADDQDQRPEHQRQDTEHGGLAQMQPAGVAKGLAQRVQRAGAELP